MDSCHHHPLGPPIDIRGRTKHPEMDHLPSKPQLHQICFQMVQFEDNKHLQKYEETDGSISYLKSNTVKQLVSLEIYMILII